MQAFFDFTVSCVHKTFIDKQEILLLFEDLFESCVESQLSALFPLFENLVLGGDGQEDEWSQNSTEGPKIKFEENDMHKCSRICRIIMSKLTVTHDLNFRGTLQRFLARTLPLTHRSGLNLRGHFNANNSTLIESLSEVREAKAAMTSSDYKNYRNFWTI